MPALASVIRQPDLARTLEEIAEGGAETFYRGALAKRLAAGMREAGVLIDERDLATPDDVLVLNLEEHWDRTVAEQRSEANGPLMITPPVGWERER